jgi:hypothetical protein
MRRRLSRCNNIEVFKIGMYEIYATGIIAFAAGLRILLIAIGWPPTNSDEGTFGVMAMDIAYRGAHPVYFYGYNYMGAAEAYLGAFYFHLFGGPSLFALRMGVITLVTLFFINIYLLTSLLFSKKQALVTLALLSIGSIPVLTRETIATGGSSQTLFLGSLAFVLITWLALTYSRDASLRKRLARLAVYGALGLTFGLGVWSDLVVLPMFAMATLLLLLFCWRELLWSWVGLLAGFAIGIVPIIKYDLAQKQNALDTLLGLVHGSSAQAPRTLPAIIHAVKATVLVTIPMATGSPFCPVSEPLPPQSDNSPHTLTCTIAHASWGLGYLLLLGIALVFTIQALRYVLRNKDVGMTERHQALVRRITQLLMLGGGVLAITVFSLSSGPMTWPGFHNRYLVTLLIITPALIAPLWSVASKLKDQVTTRFERGIVLVSRSILVLVGLIFLLGTVIAFIEVPATQAANQQRADLIGNLSRIGATHIYTDYWTCNALAFTSNERIICGVLDENLLPSHNRAPRYYTIVSADPHTVYVFRMDNQLPSLEHKLQAKGLTYRRYAFDGYIVFQPV